MNFSYRNLFDLSDKSAIVTGGAGILGRHFCHGLVEAGAKVAIVDINIEAAQKLADEINVQFPHRATAHYCDLTIEEDVERMVKEISHQLGDVTILHNNAAGKSSDLNAFFADFENYSLSQWSDILNKNLTSMFLVAKHVGSLMRNQGKGGSIIQTSSIYGIMGPDHRIYEGSFYLDRQINTPAIYSASKAGVVGLTKYLATYWAPFGIRVNTITPGGVESGQNDTFKEKYSNRIPLRRMAKAHEMVGGLLFLASEASSYITGHNLVIDGGLSAW
ncbi:SDR family oxidoreductase [Myxococcota bacterium]|nr:SDR family oxidoreductase [Myxococcota bacterium]